MQRLVILQHHEIGNIHHVADRPQPGPRKPFLQPLRRRPDTHPVNHRSGIAAAQIGIGDGDADPFRRRRPRLPVTGIRLGHPPPGKRRHFVGHAQHREAIQAVGGKIQIQNRIAQIIRQWRPQRRIIGQNHNPGMILAQPQLQLRADHPLRLHPPDPRRRQDFRPPAMGVKQPRPHPRETDLLPRRHIRRPANHLRNIPVIRPDADRAEPQPVGVGVRAHRRNHPDKHLAPPPDFRHFPHFHPGHSKPVRQFAHGNVHIHILPQPAKRNFQAQPPINSFPGFPSFPGFSSGETGNGA